MNLDEIVSGDMVELSDQHGTRVRGVVSRTASEMRVWVFGEFKAFARNYGTGRGWTPARGLKVESVQSQLWEQ